MAVAACTGVYASVSGQTINLSWTFRSVYYSNYTFYIGGSMGGSSTTTNYSWSGLGAGTYSFNVFAMDGNGNTGPAGYSNAVTVYTPPSAPRTVVATLDTLDSNGNYPINLSWLAPTSNGGSAITGYVITPSPAAPGFTATVTGTTAVVSKLARGQTYVFTVAARNAYGTGGGANSNSIQDGYQTAPGAPTGVIVSTSGIGAGVKINLSWAAPVDTGGVPITSYVITPSPALSGGNIAVNLAAKTAAISNLPYATLYTNTFQVSAVNIVGSGANSDPSDSIYLQYGTLHSLGYLDYQITSPDDPFDSGNNLKPKLEQETLVLTASTVDVYAKSNVRIGEKEEYVTPYENQKGGLKLGNNQYLEDLLAAPQDTNDGMKSLKGKVEEFPTLKDWYEVTKTVNKEIQESPTTFDKVNAGLHAFSEEEEDLLEVIDRNDSRFKTCGQLMEQMDQFSDETEWEYLGYPGYRGSVKRGWMDEAPQPSDEGANIYKIGAKEKDLDVPNLKEFSESSVSYNVKQKEFVWAIESYITGGYVLGSELIDTGPLALIDQNQAGFGYFYRQKDTNDTFLTDSEESFRFYGTNEKEYPEGPLDKISSAMCYAVEAKDKDWAEPIDKQAAGIIRKVDQEDDLTPVEKTQQWKLGVLLEDEQFEYCVPGHDTNDPIQQWIPASQPQLISTGPYATNRDTVYPPKDLRAGDVLILVFNYYTSSILATGYTKLGTGNLIDYGDGLLSASDIYWKRTNGIEPPLSVDVKDTGTFAQIYAFRDCNPTDPPFEHFQMGDGSTLSYTTSIESTQPITITVTSALGDIPPITTVTGSTQNFISDVSLFNLGVGIDTTIWEGESQPPAGSLISSTSSPNGYGCVSALFNFISIPGYWSNISTAAISTVGEDRQEILELSYDESEYVYINGHGHSVFNLTQHEILDTLEQPQYQDEFVLIDPYKYSTESDLDFTIPSSDSTAGKYVLVESDLGEKIQLDFTSTTVQFLLLGQKEDKIQAPKDKCDAQISITSEESESQTTYIPPNFVGTGPGVVISRPVLHNGNAPNMSLSPYAGIHPGDFLLATVQAGAVPTAAAYAVNAAAAAAAYGAANDAAIAAAAAAAAAPDDINLAAAAITAAGIVASAAAISATAASVAIDAADPPAAAARAAAKASTLAANSATAAAVAATATATRSSIIVSEAALAESSDPGLAVRTAEAAAAAARAVVLGTVAAAAAASGDATTASTTASDAANAAANAAGIVAGTAATAALSAETAKNSLINASSLMVLAAQGNSNLNAATSAARTAATASAVAAAAANTRSHNATSVANDAANATTMTVTAANTINAALDAPYDLSPAYAAIADSVAANTATQAVATSISKNRVAIASAVSSATTRATAASLIADNAAAAADAIASIAASNPLNNRIAAASSAVNAAATAAANAASDAADDAIAAANAVPAAESAESAAASAFIAISLAAQAATANYQAIASADALTAAADPAAVSAFIITRATNSEIAVSAAADATAAAARASDAALIAINAATAAAAGAATATVASETAAAAAFTTIAANASSFAIVTTDDSNLVATARVAAGYADSAATAADRAADRAILAASSTLTGGIVFPNDWTVLPVCGHVYTFWKITTDVEPPVLIPSVQNNVVLGSIIAYRGINPDYADPIASIGPVMSSTQSDPPTGGYGTPYQIGYTPYVKDQPQYMLYEQMPLLAREWPLTYQLSSLTAKGPSERLIAITGHDGGVGNFYPSTTRYPDPDTHLLPGQIPNIRSSIIGIGPTLSITKNFRQFSLISDTIVPKQVNIGNLVGLAVYDGETFSEGPTGPLPVLQLYASETTNFYGLLISLRGSYTTSRETAGVLVNRERDNADYAIQADNYEVEVKPTRAAEKIILVPEDSNEHQWLPGGPYKEKCYGPIDKNDYEYISANMQVEYGDRPSEMLIAVDKCKSLLRSSNKYSDSLYSALPIDQVVGGTLLHGVDSSVEEYFTPTDIYGDSDGELKETVVPKDDHNGAVQGPDGPRNHVEFFLGEDTEESGIVGSREQEDNLIPSEEEDLIMHWGRHTINIDEEARALDYCIEANVIGRDVPTDSVQGLEREDSTLYKGII